MNIKPFCPGFLNRDKIASFEEFTANAKNKFKAYEQLGLFEYLNSSHIFVYRITLIETNYAGIVALHDYEDFGCLLGHELTLLKKETDLLQVLSEIKTMIKPVLIAYDGNKEIDNFIAQTIKNKPQIKIAGGQDSELHEFWMLQEKNELFHLFKNNISCGFIADGHHRYNIHKLIYANKENYDFQFNGMMCYYLSFSQIKICSYNRGIFLAQEEKESVLEALGEYGTLREITDFKLPNVKHEVLIIYGKQFFNFKWHEEYTNIDAEVVFDIDLFNECILTNVFGIDDYRENSDIIYIEGSLTAKELIKKSKKENIMIFLFFAIEAEDIVKVSLQRKCLPPKSTWFLPRIKSGVITCKI